MAKKTDFEKAQDAQKSAKSELSGARKDLSAFLKENKLKRGKDYSKDKKHGKAFKAKTKAIEDAEATVAEANTKVKELRPRKERKTKYDYPEVKDEESGKMRPMNSDEKKKHRQKARAAVAKANKPKKEKTATKKTSSKKASSKKKGSKKKSSKEDED